MSVRTFALPLLASAALAIAAASGCGNKKYSVVRKGTLHSQMWRIWGQINQLERLMKTQPLTGSCVHCHDPDGGLRTE